MTRIILGPKLPFLGAGASRDARTWLPTQTDPGPRVPCRAEEMRASNDGPETRPMHSEDDAEAPAIRFRFRTVAARVRVSRLRKRPPYPLAIPSLSSISGQLHRDQRTTPPPPPRRFSLPSSPPAAATTTLTRMEAPAAVPTFSSSSSSSTAPRSHRRLLASPALGRSARTLLPPPRAVASSRAPLLVSHPPPAPAAHAKVDRSGRFCSPRAARELAMMISYAACLEGTDVVRLFDRRVAARSEPGFVFNKACLLSYNHMSFGGGPLEVGTEEEAEKLMSQNEKDSVNEAEVLSAPPKLVYNNFVLRLARDILVAVASGWDQHVDIIDKIVPQNWKDEPVARILELCILHIAMAEMTSKGTPHKVAINEAVDLAKRFCDGGAPRVINGCLRTFVKDHMNIGPSQPADSKA